MYISLMLDLFFIINDERKDNYQMIGRNGKQCKTLSIGVNIKILDIFDENNVDIMKTNTYFILGYKQKYYIK